MTVLELAAELMALPAELLDLEVVTLDEGAQHVVQSILKVPGRVGAVQVHRIELAGWVSRANDGLLFRQGTGRTYGYDLPIPKVPGPDDLIPPMPPIPGCCE